MDVIAADGSLRRSLCPIELTIPAGMNWIIPGNIKYFAFKTLSHGETSKYKGLLTYADQELNLFIQSKHHSPAQLIPAHASPQG